MQIVFKSTKLSNRIFRICFIICGFIILTSILTRSMDVNYFISCILSGVILVPLYDLVFLRSKRKEIYDALVRSRNQISGITAMHNLHKVSRYIQPFYYDAIAGEGLSYVRKYNSMRWNYLCKSYSESHIADDILKNVNRSALDCTNVGYQLARLKNIDLEDLKSSGFENMYEYYCTYMYLWQQLTYYDANLDPYPPYMDGFRFLDINHAEIRFYKQLTNELVLTCSVDGEYAHIYKYKIFAIEDKNKFLKGAKLDKI